MGKGEGNERKAKSRYDAKAADIIGRRSAEDRGCTTRSLGESQSEKEDSQSLVRFPSKLTALLKQRSCTRWAGTCLYGYLIRAWPRSNPHARAARVRRICSFQVVRTCHRCSSTELLSVEDS